MAVKKLGHPVPLSYFIAEVKRGRLQPAQTKTPGRFSAFSGLEPGRSVPSSRSTSYAAGGRIFFHSALLRLSGVAEAAISAPSASSDFQFFCSSSMPFIDAACAAQVLTGEPKGRAMSERLCRKE